MYSHPQFKVRTLQLLLRRINNSNDIFHRASNDCKINLNHLHIAKTAYDCEAHFTAILYAELATMEQKESNDEIKSILSNAHRAIGEMDAVPAFLDPLKNRTEYLHQNHKWNEIHLQQDVMACTDNQSLQSYANYLKESGLYLLSHNVKRSMNEVDYECAWRLGDWTFNETDFSDTEKSITEINAEKYHYFALKCLQEKDRRGVKLNLKAACAQIIESFKQSSHECTKNIYKNLGLLHMLQQIEEFSDVIPLF